MGKLFDKVCLAAVRQRQKPETTVRLLTEAQIPFAIAGDYAIGYWIEQVDEGAIRNPVDVDLRRC